MNQYSVKIKEKYMKILVIHNFHRSGSASGDDQVFKNEIELLQKKGNDVLTYTVNNDSFDQMGILGKIQTTIGMLWSFKNYYEVKGLIKAENPDIVHIHTFFPLLSPSVLYAVKRSGKKLIATLHDTRFVCPCATSLRGKELCNRCGDGHYIRMVRYACFKNSRIQSLIVAGIFKYHRVRKTFYKQIDRYICLNDNQIRLLEDIGFDKRKIIKKYNFVTDNNQTNSNIVVRKLPQRFVLFYGRIGEEKGVRILQKIWSKMNSIPLVIMGGGPLEGEIKKWADEQEEVFYLGYVPHDECLQIVKKCEFVVFPSIWYEGCSMVEIETQSLGKAIIATDLGFSKEAITDGINGYKVSLEDVAGFITTIQNLWKNPDECKRMGSLAREDYENKYLPDDNYKQLMKVYKSVL